MSLAGWRAAASASIVALAAGACGPPARESIAPTAAHRRAIFLSLDALSESRVRTRVPPASVPALLAYFDAAACADGARPAFPSQTAPSHAALWTGAYGDVNGIAGNTQPLLPRDSHTLLETVSGYFVDGLRAEPIWLTAAAAGRSVVTQHATQGPRAPAFPSVFARDSGEGLRRRAVAESLLALPRVAVLNGYNTLVAPHQIITERQVRPRPAVWRGSERLETDRQALEIAWAIPGDSLFGLFYGRGRYDRVIVNRVRDVAGAVVAIAAPVERGDPRSHPLARFFSEGLRIPVGDRVAHTFVRLFDLSPDASSFRLYQTEARPADANTLAVGAAYDAATGGWIGNAALNFPRDAFGTLIADGGDGTAELHWLESAELLTRQYLRGAEWAWNVRRPDLFVDYFPLADQLDHGFLGLASPEVPGADPARVARAEEVRRRGWMLVDTVLAAHRARARASGALLLVGGDHGMRPYWRLVRPNVILAAAGLLVADSAGRIDLTRTRALSPNGYWISVNGTDRRGGIVSAQQRAAVLRAADSALRAARDEWGRPVVERSWVVGEADSLGRGGPAGGDLYFEPARGLYFDPAARGAAVTDIPPTAGHGFESTAPDMQTVLCAEFPGARPRRTAPARVIDAAPTVSEWLGIPAPRDARGRSLLRELGGGPPR